MGDMIVPDNKEYTNLDPSDVNEIYQIVDPDINDAIRNHDIRIVVDKIRVLRKGARIVGLALVRVLGRINENWSVFGINEPIIDFLVAETDLNRATIDRYIGVYEMLKAAPAEVRPKLEQMNVKNLIPLGNMVKQGWELEEDDWKKVANATDFIEVSEITRQLKGQEPRSSGLRLWINRNGEVYAFKTNKETKEEERRFICTLPVEDEDDPIITQAVERIIRGSGMLKQ